MEKTWIISWSVAAAGANSTDLSIIKLFSLGYISYDISNVYLFVLEKITVL